MMNRLSFRNKYKYLVFPLLVLPLLFTGFSCMPTDEAALAESLLDNLESMGGEMSFVTKDGKVINITVSQEAVDAAEDEQKKNEEECDDEKNADKEYEDEKNTDKTGNKDNSDELSNYLPTLNCIEDVFKTLGVWETADVLYGEQPDWAHVAAELGYTEESMYAALHEIIKARLHEAKVKGLISYDQYEYKVELYGEKAHKWTNKIFAAAVNGDKPELAHYLPQLDSIEDVFKTLGVWETAADWHEAGHTWAHIAAELGYDMDSMYAALHTGIKNQLHEAKTLGLITYEQYEYKVNHYTDKALHWINEIF